MCSRAGGTKVAGGFPSSTISPLRANRFSKQYRLAKAAQFQAVYGRGEKRVSRSFVVFAISNTLMYSRFGLTTPRKLGKAHERNRIKRRVREILRTSRTAIPVGFDFVLNPRRSAIGRDYEELRSELVCLLGARG